MELIKILQKIYINPNVWDAFMGNLGALRFYEVRKIPADGPIVERMEKAGKQHKDCIYTLVGCISPEMN